MSDELQSSHLGPRRFLVVAATPENRARLVARFRPLRHLDVHAFAGLDDLAPAYLSGEDAVLICFDLLACMSSRNRRVFDELSRNARVLIGLKGTQVYEAASKLREADAWVFIDQTLVNPSAVLALSEARIAVIPAELIGAFDLEAIRLEAVTSLSAEERDVLQALGAGLSNHRISVQLGFSETRTKAMIRNILRHLHFRNRTEAGVFAARRHLGGEA